MFFPPRLARCVCSVAQSYLILCDSMDCVAYQAPPSMGFSRQEYWSGVPLPSRPFRYNLNQIPYDYTVKVRNRFKGLDLIDRVPDELWMEVHDTAQETGSKTIPKKKKCKKAKWLSKEALQIAVKRK